MSFKIIPRKELNPEWWDNRLNACSNALVFGNSWYWDALVGKNWSGFYHAETGTMIQAAHRTLFGFPISYLQPIWCRPSGPYAPTPERLPDFSEFQNSLPSGILKVGLHLEWPGIPGIRRVYQRSSFPIELKKNAIRNLKKNKNFKLTLSPTDPASINEFFFSNRGKEMRHLQGKWKKAMLRLMLAGTGRGVAWNFSVQDQNKESHATACFFTYKKSLTYIHGSVNEKGKRSGAMFFLFHEILSMAQEKDFDFVDFGGSNQMAVANFYQSFGGQDQVYTVYSKNRIPRRFL